MSNSLKHNPCSILMLTTDRKIDRRTLQQADSLEAAGWQVTILAMPQEKNRYSQEDPRIVRIETNTSSIRLKDLLLLSIYKKIRRYLPMNTYIMQRMKRFVWTFLANPESFYLNLFANQLFKFSPQIVMAIDLPMLPVAVALARQSKSSLVYDSHELYSEQEFSSLEKKRWQYIESKYIHDCHAVITVNSSIASELVRRYKIPPVNIIYNAVHCDDLLANSSLFHQAFNLPAKRKILLFQGGLSKGRNLETLIQAIQYVKNPFIDLVILGDGQLSSTLKKLAISANVKNRVYFHPEVPQKLLLKYTQSADAGLIPYQATCLNNYYCTPNKLFEFIAAGLPILASDLPEISNIINTHKIGLTGRLSTPKEIARMIDVFFQDEKLYQCKQNVLMARKTFCWRHEEKKLIKIFEAMK